MSFNTSKKFFESAENKQGNQQLRPASIRYGATALDLGHQNTRPASRRCSTTPFNNHDNDQTKFEECQIRPKTSSERWASIRESFIPKTMARRKRLETLMNQVPILLENHRRFAQSKKFFEAAAAVHDQQQLHPPVESSSNSPRHHDLTNDVCQLHCQTSTERWAKIREIYLPKLMARKRAQHAIAMLVKEVPNLIAAHKRFTG